MKSRVTVPRSQVTDRRGTRDHVAAWLRAPAGGPACRAGLRRGAPGVRGRGWSRDAGAQDERAPQKTTRLGLPGAPAPGRAAARAPRAPAPRQRRGRSTAYPRSSRPAPLFPPPREMDAPALTRAFVPLGVAAGTAPARLRARIPRARRPRLAGGFGRASSQAL